MAQIGQNGPIKMLTRPKVPYKHFVQSMGLWSFMGYQIMFTLRSIFVSSRNRPTALGQCREQIQRGLHKIYSFSLSKKVFKQNKEET
jgi:hypothetical protein